MTAENTQSSARPTDVIVCGHLCMDLIPAMPHISLANLVIPGRLYETGPLILATGGAVSNAGLALQRLGVNVQLMSTVGDDLMGQSILKFLRDHGESLTDLITVQPNQPSSYTIVLSPENTDRTFLHCAGTNETFGAADVDFALIKQSHARVFHLGYPPLLPHLLIDNGRELQDIMRRAKAAGTVTSLDTVMFDPQGPNGRLDWASIWRDTLPHVDIFLPTIDEILLMLRRQDYFAWIGHVLEHITLDYLRDLADELIGMGVVIAGFKLGERGLYLRTADRSHFDRLRTLPIKVEEWASVEHYMPAYQVEVAGTTGAGDSAYAGFITGLLKGLTPRESMRWACAVGACNVEAQDSTSGLRSLAETQQRIEAGWRLRPERLAGT